MLRICDRFYALPSAVGAESTVLLWLLNAEQAALAAAGAPKLRAVSGG